LVRISNAEDFIDQLSEEGHIHTYMRTKRERNGAKSMKTKQEEESNEKKRQTRRQESLQSGRDLIDSLCSL
jgi:hypothetical protein